MSRASVAGVRSSAHCGIRSVIVGLHEVVSHGDNVYPARVSYGSPTLNVSENGKAIMTAFDDLMAIFEELSEAAGNPAK